MNTDQFIAKVAQLATSSVPFFFLIDFERIIPLALTFDEAKEEGLFFEIGPHSNLDKKAVTKIPNLSYHPISKSIFQEKFENVLEHIQHGDSYLLNLTFPSKLQINLGLGEVFHLANAKYKLWKKDDFVVFSPETFIKIKENQIFTYPMKGTIDASLLGAENQLLGNQKEEWEHNTIVDLMRNDLALVAENIEVLRYRFVEKIKTHKHEILQTSSEICGNLPQNWKENLGEILLKLLPAGSISGAPKQKTVEIIEKNEVKKRGYYTGIFGIFDGNQVDSGVAIRYIEQEGSEFWFRSGGGITFHSQLEEEYQELISKIYVPTF
jgi:para-aminobenzoate synthetase component I